MDNDDLLLNQALSQLSEASELKSDEEVEEVARVRKARASVTEHARQTGDCVGNLLSGLIDESNAEIEAEKAEKERKAREAEEKKRREAQEEADRKRREAEAKLQEEKRKLEEKGERRTLMLQAIEKKRKQEAGEIDEEEEARKRQEAEAEAARKAAEKAREEAEAAQLKSSNEELAEQIRIIKANKAADEQAAAEKKKKIQITKYSLVAAVFVGIIVCSVLAYTAWDYARHAKQYTLADSYPTIVLTMRNDLPTSSNVEVAFNEVKQSAPKTVSKGSGHRGPAKPTDQYGIGKTVDLSGKTIVK